MGREWGVGEEVDECCGVEVIFFLEEMGPVVAERVSSFASFASAEDDCASPPPPPMSSSWRRPAIDDVELRAFDFKMTSNLRRGVRSLFIKKLTKCGHRRLFNLKRTLLHLAGRP